LLFLPKEIELKRGVVKNTNPDENPFKLDAYALGVSMLKMMGLSLNEIQQVKRDFDR
jgi:hypothetical protein